MASKVVLVVGAVLATQLSIYHRSAEPVEDKDVDRISILVEQRIIT